MPWHEGITRPVALAELGQRYRRYRLADPEAEEAMAGSLRRWGQLAPVVDRGGPMAANLLAATGRRIATINSPGPSALSCSGVSPGRQCSASTAISRRPLMPSISAIASNATSGTQRSDGCVAMQELLQPSTACWRVSPPCAPHPEPGARLLQALAVS